MAQVKLLKVASDGASLEMDSAADEITLLSGQFGNVKLSGNDIISTDTNGNINITPDGTGDLVLDGLNWPQADGSPGQHLQTNGAGQLSFVTPATSTATKLCNSYTAAVILAAREFVYISSADNVSKADVSGAGAASRVLGISDAAAAAAAPVDICSEGVISGFTGLTAGARYYADPAVAGGMTTTLPVGTGNTIVQVGYAKSTTELHLHIEQMGRRA